MKVILAVVASILLYVGQPAVSAEGIGGVHHIGLTVTDLDASQAFFTEAPGFSVAGGDPDYPSVFVSNGEILNALWRASDPDNATQFNRKTNVGLHHLALSVESFDALGTLYEELRKAHGVEIEFAPEPLTGSPARHMMTREPSGNRLEFIHWPPA